MKKDKKVLCFFCSVHSWSVAIKMAVKLSDTHTQAHPGSYKANVSASSWIVKSQPPKFQWGLWSVNPAFWSLLVTFLNEQNHLFYSSLSWAKTLRNERFKDLRGIYRLLTPQLNIFLGLGNVWSCINSTVVAYTKDHKLLWEFHPFDRHYFLWAVPLVALPGLFPERRTGTLDTGILVRTGAGSWVFGGGDSASRTDDSAEWLTEWGGVDCLLLTGILDSRGRLVLPFIDRKEEEEEEEGGVVWEVGLSLYSVDGEGVLCRSASSSSSSGSL